MRSSIVIVACLLLPLFRTSALGAERIKAFPGAVGRAAYTPSGRGGKIVRVTNLNADGPGSFAAAVQTKGPRTIVFEVGGVIDLQKKSIVIAEPFLTIAGQTAPSPGITFIRGGIAVCTHDVVVRHIRVRPGEAGARPWDRDAIDQRIIRETREGTGKIIDAEKEVGGYPTIEETRSRFNPEEWDMATMERKQN